MNYNEDVCILKQYVSLLKSQINKEEEEFQSLLKKRHHHSFLLAGVFSYLIYVFLIERIRQISEYKSRFSEADLDGMFLFYLFFFFI
jgi:hypothetical protein